MPIVICANCQSAFEKAARFVRQSTTHFCSRSCAAQLNNRLYPKRRKSAPEAPPEPASTIVKPPEPTEKMCGRCKMLKPLGDFYQKGKESSAVHAFCKECFNAYCISRWKQRKRDAVTYLGGKCEDCGQVFHPNVYDFHHLSDKDCTWTQLRLRPWKQIRAELDKCALLCANCHRMRHVDQNE